MWHISSCIFSPERGKNRTPISQRGPKCTHSDPWLHSIINFKLTTKYWFSKRWKSKYLSTCTKTRTLCTITYKSSLTQKKFYNKTDTIFSIYGKNGINPWHFFWIVTWPFEVVEVEGGRLVKEADFEAEKNFLLKQKI